MNIGRLLLRVFRVVAILAPVAALLLFSVDTVALAYQKSLCPNLGSEYNGGFVFPSVSLAIIDPPWLLLAVSQLFRFSKKLSVVDLLGVAIVGCSIWSAGESAMWFFIPKLNGPQCDFWFWRHFRALTLEVDLVAWFAGYVYGVYLLCLAFWKALKSLKRPEAPK